MKKLTKAQHEVLLSVAENGSFSCYELYAPACKLIELGLVRLTDKSFATITIVLTATGRSVIQSASPLKRNRGP